MICNHPGVKQSHGSLCKLERSTPDICLFSKRLVGQQKISLIVPRGSQSKVICICSRYLNFFLRRSEGGLVALCRRWGAKIGGEVGVITRGDVTSSIFHLRKREKNQQWTEEETHIHIWKNIWQVFGKYLAVCLQRGVPIS